MIRQHNVFELDIPVDYRVRVEVLERLPDLIRDRACHIHSQGLVLSLCDELLKVASRHVLHDDAVLVVASELLLETHDVRAVFTLGLQRYFATNLSQLLALV